MKPVIKLNFTDFWKNFNSRDNYFLDIISQEFDVRLDDKNPDFLIYSVFGHKFRNYNCLRIFYTGENIKPNFSECDYAFSFEFSNYPKNYRLPVYPIYGDVLKLSDDKPDFEDIRSQKTRFCNFVYRNARVKLRNELFRKLCKYRHVDSGGLLMNNIGYQIPDKLEFISKYKFTIAFENEVSSGYTTEKLFEPMLVNSIPIYYGNPLVFKDFNKKSFIDYADFEDLDELIEKIIEIDNDDEKWAEILSQPWYNNNEVNEYVNPENVLEQFKRIFSSQIEPVSRKSYYFAKSLLFKGIAKSIITIKDTGGHFVKKASGLALNRIALILERYKSRECKK